MKTKLTNPEIITCESLPHDEVITTPQSEELKKECVDFIFNESNYDNESFHDSISIDKLKSFISSLLAKQQEEFVKCIPEEKENAYGYLKEFITAVDGYNACIADIKSKLNK